MKFPIAPFFLFKRTASSSIIRPFFLGDPNTTAVPLKKSVTPLTGHPQFCKKKYPKTISAYCKCYQMSETTIGVDLKVCMLFYGYHNSRYQTEPEPLRVALPLCYACCCYLYQAVFYCNDCCHVTDDAIMTLY